MNYVQAQPFIECLILIASLYLIFFKKYFEEKGKNLATKEDIGEITATVESTKEFFVQNNELLKNQLNLYSGSYLSIKGLERNALIDLNLKYTIWMHSLKSFSLVYYSYDFYEPLLRKDLFFSEKQMEFDVAEDILHLYVHDPELITLTKDLKTATYKLHLSVIENIITFIRQCKDYNRIAANLHGDELVAVHKHYLSLQGPVIDKSIQEMSDYYKLILPIQIKFIKALNQRIYKLIDQ